MSADFQDWIGRQTRCEDVITPELVRRFCATFDAAPESLEDGAPAPLGLHWCLALPVSDTAQSGSDGHAQRGLFLPPVALPRRMWAGGELEFLTPLRIGDAVRRTSTIADAMSKQGRSGALCFVTVRHEI